MARGVLIGCLLLGLLVLPGNALAASDVQLKHAADGTLIVVGTGWRRDQNLVVSLGRQHYAVRVDASGDFELATGVASFQGELSIQHPAAQDPAFMTLPTTPNPLAVLFAWSVAEGAALLGIVAGLWLVAAGVTRRLRAGGYPR